MFLIAGVTARKVITDATPRRCPQCGLVQARYGRTDHYLSLFFIPLIRVKKGPPTLRCQRCQGEVHGPARQPGEKQHPSAPTCGLCGGHLQPGFNFCPHCGSRI